MTSIVSICNGALGKLGASSITSLTDSSANARACNDHYEQARDLVLQAHPWTFARKRAELAQLVETPAFGFAYYYQLPADYLRLLEIAGNEDGRMEYTLEGSRILSGETSMKIAYIARITDPNQFAPLFVQALEYQLAARIAYRITQNRSLMGDMATLYRDTLTIAQQVDSQNLQDQRVDHSDWLSARETYLDPTIVS